MRFFHRSFAKEAFLNPPKLPPHAGTKTIWKFFIIDVCHVFLFGISMCAVWRLMEIHLRPVLPLPPHLISQSASRSMSSRVNRVQLNAFSTWHPNKRCGSKRSQRSNRQQRHKNYLWDTEWPRLSVLVPIMHRADKRAGKQRWRFLSAWQLQRGRCHFPSDCKRTVMGRFMIFFIAD